MVWISLALAGVMAGPPKLPPMPGQGAPAPDPVTAKLPTQTPTAKPVTPTTTAKPVTPTTTATPVTTTPAPTTTAPPSPTTTTDVPTPFVPPNAEPPQPEPSSAPPPREGAGASPPMPTDRRRNDRLREPLPGGGDETPMPKLPKRLQPPYKGIGLFTGAGVMLGVALAEQIASHVIVKRRCIDPAAEQAMMTDPFDDNTDVEDLGNAIIKCVPGILPVVALRVNSDLALIAMIGMATAGGILRGERVAYDHVFAARMSKRIPKLRGAGIGLAAVGAVTWLTLGAASWGVLAKCDDAKCAARSRAMGFSTRTIGAAMVAAGAAMLGFSESYRRRHEQFNRERAMSWAPMFGRGIAGVSLSSRF